MKSLYLFYGEEKYLIAEELKRLKASLKDAAIETFEDLSASKLLEILTVPNLFAPKRILILKEFDLGQDDEILTRAFKNIPKTDVVVLIDPEGLDKRKKVFKSISKIAEVIECRPFTDWQTEELAEWIVKIAQKFKKQISSDDAEFIVEICGRDLSILHSEVEKISTFIGSKPRIERKDIESIATRGGIDAFGLALALRHKQVKPSFMALQRLLDDREDPIQLLGLLASQYRMLFRIKLLSRSGLGRQAMAKKLSASPYYIQKLSEVSVSFTEEELKKCLNVLLECDLKLKSGGRAVIELPLLISELLNA